MFLKRQKIIFLISALAVLNLIFLFDIFFIDGAIAEESYCYSQDEVFYYPESLTISESRTCDSDCNIENNGRLLFKYYGEDSDCLSDDNSGVYAQKKCYEEYPYGGPGTLETGGNLAVNNVRGLYLNGFDNGGFHWILSGTQIEPQGRAMGFKFGLEDVYFGRSVVVGDDLKLEGRIELVDDNFVARVLEKRVMGGLSCSIVGPPNWPFNEISFNGNLHILEGQDRYNGGADQGICGEDYCDGDIKRCRPTSGGDYRTVLDEVAVIKGNIKLEGNIYVHWSRTMGGNSKKVAYYKQLVRDYYRQEEERKEEFTGHTACCATNLTERDAYGIYYPSVLSVRHCWPQPLNHYKIINYRYDAISNSAVGDIVLCPAMADNTTGPPGSSPSCQSCESSDLVTYPGSTTYGCPE
ncbi:hypothetical protein K8R62_03970 [bacterium]|nr:hypothetical protein [bacterium]